MNPMPKAICPRPELTRINIRSLVDACRIYVDAGMSARAAECARRAARYGRRLLEHEASLDEQEWSRLLQERAQ